MALKETTIYKVCSYLRNWFDKNQPRFSGTIEITNGALPQTYGLVPGQYFRIVDSKINNGIYQYPVTQLHNETFVGSIIGMGIPSAVVEIMEEIDAWSAKYGSADSVNMSPYNSERFGGYSCSKSGGGGNDTTKSKAGTWQGAFGAELQPWRKM